MSVSVKLCEIFWYDIDCLWSPWTCWLRCNWRSRLWVDVGPDPESLGSRFKWRESLHLLHLRSQIQSIHPSTFHQPESFHPDQNPALIFGFCDLHRLPRRLWWKEIALEQVFHVNAMGRGGDPGDPCSSRSCRWLQCLPTNFWSQQQQLPKNNKKEISQQQKISITPPVTQDGCTEYMGFVQSSYVELAFPIKISEWVKLGNLLPIEVRL